MAIRLARESQNDYLPELEAVSGDEMEHAFRLESAATGNLKAGEILRNTFRFLGVVRAGETFYLFARLDPYEQAEADRQSLSSPPSLGLFHAKTQSCRNENLRLLAASLE